MKKEKLLALALTLVLSGCGNANENESKKADETKEAVTAEEAGEMTAPADMGGAQIIEGDDREIEDLTSEIKKFDSLPDFTAKDQDGNPYSLEDIKKNNATVINLWFTGCSACIAEMDALNELADEIHGADDGVEFISMCTDVNYDESTKEAYDRIMADKKPTYKALAVDYEGEMKSYLETIFAYPTTIVVDKNGTIIGSPVVGALTNEDQIHQLNANIDQAIKSSKAL